MAESLYVSYAWKAEEQNRLVDRLEAACSKRGIALKRDRNEIGYGESIRAFMDEIGRGRHVVLVLSDAYFRSRYCMYELREIKRHGDLIERVHPVVLRDTSLEPEDRVQYLAYWEKREADLEAKLSGLRRRKTQNLNNAVDDYGEFRDQLDELLGTLADPNSLTEEIHVDTDFAALLDRLMPPASGGRTPQARSGRNRIPDPAFRAKIVEQIQQVLSGSPVLTEALAANAATPQAVPAQDLAAVLCTGELETVFDDLLRPALKDCHQRLDALQFERVWDAAKTVVGWLCLLWVDDDWVRTQERAESADTGPSLEMVVKTAFGQEIVSARYRQIRPKPVLSPGTSDLVGADAIRDPDGGNSWNDDYAMQQLLLAIWSRVFPEESRNSLSAGDENKLNKALYRREKYGTHHYYIPVSREQGQRLCQPDFYNALLARLPAITVLFFRSSGNDYALRVDDEDDFLTLVREFLELPHHLAKRT